MLIRRSLLQHPPRMLHVRDFGHRESLLLGTRAYRLADVAQHVEVSPSRHVLSQMVVAGVMFHQPPIQVRIAAVPSENPGDGESAPKP